MKGEELALHRQEQVLNDKEADLFREETKMEHLEGAYFHHLTQATHLFNELSNRFQQTDKITIFVELSHEVYQGAQKMNESLNDVRDTLNKERRQVQQQLEDVYEEKRHLATKEEEATS